LRALDADEERRTIQAQGMAFQGTENCRLAGFTGLADFPGLMA
jgi:hypothetical protein